ncbi:GNAT family N-acetyltransferase [Geodermatophilus sp. SYSU D00697]
MAVTVRPLTDHDVPALTRLLVANRAFLAPTSPHRPDEYGTEEFQRRDTARLLEQAEAGTVIPAVVLLDGEVVGRISVNNVVRGPLQSGTLGYWVAEAVNGRGVATAAVAAMVRVAFGEAGLHRLEAGTLVDNLASQRVLRRNGFERFGLAPRYLRIAGEWRDHVLFQLVNEAWVDPEAELR